MRLKEEEKFDKAIEDKNCNFSAFVFEAVKVALENIEDEK